MMATSSNVPDYEVTLPERIRYITPAEQQTHSFRLIPPPGSTSPPILEPSMDFYVSRFPVDNLDFEAAYKDLQKAVKPTGARLATQDSRYGGRTVSPISATAVQVAQSPYKPFMHWTWDDVGKGLCEPGDWNTPRTNYDIEQEQKRLYRLKVGMGGASRVKATQDIFTFPGAVEGTIYNPRRHPEQRDIKNAIVGRTYPEDQSRELLLHRTPAFLALLGFLDHFFTLDLSNNAPHWKYRAFCVPVYWVTTRGDASTCHAGILYGGAVYDPATKEPGFKLIFFEPHPKDPGCFNEFPMEVILMGQILGLSRIYRMFGNQGDEDNCSAYALQTLANITLNNMRPDLKHQHQVVPLPLARPVTDGMRSARVSFRLTLPDWLKE